MAVTVTPNLTDITLGESGDTGYWTGTDGYQIEVFRQGNAAEGWIVSKNSSETGVYDAYTSNSNTLFDMSAANTHLYLSIRCDIAPFFDYLRIALQSDTTHGSASNGTTWWTIVDNTTNIEWYGEWKTFVLDVNSTATDGDSTGTLDLAGISDVHINVDNSNSGNIRSIENTYIDCIRFGTGLTITGVDWDFADVAAVDNSSTYKWDIIRKVGPGIFELNGQINIGNGSTSTGLISSNETLFFRDPSTAGESGGPLGKLADNFYKITFQGSGCTAELDNVSVISSSNYPFVLDADDTNLPSNSVDWSGGLIIEASSVLLKSSQTYFGMTFESCGQVEPSTSTFSSITFSNHTSTGLTSTGAMLYPTNDSNISDITFINCDNGVHYNFLSDSTLPAFDNFQFDDVSGKYDVLNNTDSAITISKNNGSNPNSYNPSGSAVTFVGPAVTTTITVKDLITTDAIEGARVLVEVADDTNTSTGFPYQVVVTISQLFGSLASVWHPGHNMNTGDNVIIRGAEQDYYNGVFPINVIGESAYWYDAGETLLVSPATGTKTATFAFINALTSSTGVVSDTRVVPIAQPFKAVIRKATTSPYYQQGTLVDTIDDEDGYSGTVLLVRDD